nr:MAG: ADP-ribose pyrophosphatase [Candidatus Nanosalinarum sp. J07AB56]
MNSACATEFGSKAYVFDEESRLLVVRRSDEENHGQHYWEVPGGQLDAGESPSNSVEREVNEETSLEVKILEPFDTWFFEKDSDTNIVGVDFLAKQVDGQVTLSAEHDEYQWLSQGSTGEMEFYGSIGGSVQKAFQIHGERYE